MPHTVLNGIKVLTTATKPTFKITKQDKVGIGLDEFGMATATMKMKLYTGRILTRLEKGGAA